MPRNHIPQEPRIINKIVSEKSEADTLQLSTGNNKKLEEFKRILKTLLAEKSPNIQAVDLKLDEVQSLDPYEVVSKKAQMAWEKNGYNPILVEDTSLEMFGLGGRPGTFADSFTKDVEIRRLICESWLKDRDRRALARVLIAIFDGVEARIFEGKTEGKISETLRGVNGFGWDDMFIPKGSTKTFAEMEDIQKDKFSMRRKAIEELGKSNLKPGNWIFELPEPFESELKRVNTSNLKDSMAIKFAYSLESLEDTNEPNTSFTAQNYSPVISEDTLYYTRYMHKTDSASIGLIVTDVDRSDVRLYKNGEPVFWQMGSERRHLALAQRAEYFLKNCNKDVIERIRDIEKGKLKISPRRNTTNPAVDFMLKVEANRGDSNAYLKDMAVNAKAVKELGYKKIASNQEVSRTVISEYGLFNKVGKYPRKVIGVGSLPSVSGWRDVVITTVLGHMPVFIPRNNIFAGNIERQINLVNEAKFVLKNIGIPKNDLEIFERNIGVAIGTDNPAIEVEKVKRFYKEAGVKLFRIYTINSDPRVVKTAELIRNEFDDNIEIFVGQVACKKQALELLEKAKVDALIFGHGGGRQCTSATNGMAITTLEEVYTVIKDDRFNDTSILVEGGVGTNLGGLLVLGVDCILYNQQLVKGTIETGGLFLEHKTKGCCQPYHGSASAPTMIIEASNQELHSKRINDSGRTKVPEGKPGYMLYGEKANSMSFWVDEFNHNAARTLADLGVMNMSELRKLLVETDVELLRVVSPVAAETAKAYKNG